MIIKNYREISPDVWNSFVSSCQMGHTYFTYEMTSLPPARKMSKRQYKNMSFGIFNDKEELLLVFQLFCWQKKQNFFNRLIKKKSKINLTSFHGLCVKDNLSKKEYKNLKQTFEMFLDSFFYKYQCKGLDIALPPFCDLLRPEKQPVMNPVINWNFFPFMGYTYLVDLNLSIEEIWSGYTQTTRNLINKIIKDTKVGFFETDGNEKDFEILTKLNDACYQFQDKNKKLTEEYLKELWKIVKKRKYCRCFFGMEDKKINCYIITVLQRLLLLFLGRGTKFSKFAKIFIAFSDIAIKRRRIKMV